MNLSLYHEMKKTLALKTFNLKMWLILSVHKIFINCRLPYWMIKEAKDQYFLNLKTNMFIVPNIMTFCCNNMRPKFNLHFQKVKNALMKFLTSKSQYTNHRKNKTTWNKCLSKLWHSKERKSTQWKVNNNQSNKMMLYNLINHKRKNKV